MKMFMRYEIIEKYQKKFFKYNIDALHRLSHKNIKFIFTVLSLLFFPIAIASECNRRG